MRSMRPLSCVGLLSTILLTACAFMDYDGFVSNQSGQLSWHGRSDAVRLAVLAGAAIVGAAVRRTRRSRMQAAA